MSESPRADLVDLASRIEAHADALAERTLVRMYENPFWEARFGERGRRFAAQDQHHHIRHLVIALRIGGPETMGGYARWLQVVLTSRGMCSRHLADNFAGVAEAISTGIDRPEPALAYLRAAEAALRYDDGPARAVQEAIPVLAEEAVSALANRHPEWLGRWGEASYARCQDDVVYHLSYLADSLALERPDLFTSYVRWIAGFLSGLGVPRLHLAETFDALRRAGDRRLPAEHRVKILEGLIAGREAIREEGL